MKFTCKGDGQEDLSPYLMQGHVSSLYICLLLELSVAHCSLYCYRLGTKIRKNRINVHDSSNILLCKCQEYAW